MSVAPLTRREYLASSAALVIGFPVLTEFAVGATHTRSQQPSDLGIMPREVWATDRPPLGPLPPEEVRFLLVHHTVTRNDYTEDAVPSLLRGFYDHHTGNKGWNDIAYNFVIDRFGGIWETRAGSLAGPVAGDATGGNQGFTQLCAIIGDFTEVMPSDESIESLSLLLASLAVLYDVDTTPGAEITFTSRGSNRWPAGEEVTTASVSGHRDMSQTACPGDTFYPYVQEHLPARVHEVRQAVDATTTTSTTTTTTTTTIAPTTTAALALPPDTTGVAAPTTTGPTGAWTSNDVAVPIAGGLAGLAVAAVLAGLGAITYRRSRSG